MQMLGSFAEFERSMVRERTRVGLAAARDRGVKLGRPGKLPPQQQQQEVIRTVREFQDGRRCCPTVQDSSFKH